MNPVHIGQIFRYIQYSMSFLYRLAGTTRVNISLANRRAHLQSVCYIKLFSSRMRLSTFNHAKIRKFVFGNK